MRESLIFSREFKHEDILKLLQSEGRNNYLSYSFCPSESTGSISNNASATGTDTLSDCVKFGEGDLLGKSSFLDFNESDRFVERIGEYDYKSRIIDSTTGGLVDEGTIELDNGEIVEADITVSRRKIIQFIYLVN